MNWNAQRLAPSIGTALFSDGVVHTHMCFTARGALRMVRGAPLCGATPTAIGECKPTDPNVCAECSQRAEAWLKRQGEAASGSGHGSQST